LAGFDYESIHNPQTPHVNKINRGIKEKVEIVFTYKLKNK
jgi:hypothetical protein